jgi:hypothetical protein
VGGTEALSHELFCLICGPNALSRVVMATNHWDTIHPEVGNIREKDLQTDFWATTLNSGAYYKRIESPQQDIGDIIEYILAKQFEAAVIKIQEELGQLEKRVGETEAGETLAETLQRRLGHPNYRFDSVMHGDQYLNNAGLNDLIIVSVISIFSSNRSHMLQVLWDRLDPERALWVVFFTS